MAAIKLPPPPPGNDFHSSAWQYWFYQLADALSVAISAVNSGAGSHGPSPAFAESSIAAGDEEWGQWIPGPPGPRGLSGPQGPVGLDGADGEDNLILHPGLLGGNVALPGVLSAAASTATPSGGSAQAVLLLGTTAGFGIYYGTGAPTVSAAAGSLYIRTDNAGANLRLYSNTTGSTTWAAITSA